VSLLVVQGRSLVMLRSSALFVQFGGASSVLPLGAGEVVVVCVGGRALHFFVLSLMFVGLLMLGAVLSMLSLLSSFGWISALHSLLASCALRRCSVGVGVVAALTSAVGVLCAVAASGVLLRFRTSVEAGDVLVSGADLLVVLQVSVGVFVVVESIVDLR
jgi:hypothetical protein